MPKQKHPLVTKTCKVCGLDKPHHTYATGKTYARCQDCRNERRRARWKLDKQDAAKLEKKRESDRRFARSPEGRAAARRFHRSDKGRAARRSYKVSEAGKETARRNWRKHAARRLLERKVACGEIVKPTRCQHCQHEFEVHQIQGHHHNGYAPEHQLDVVWLCDDRHKKEDGLVSNGGAHRWYGSDRSKWPEHCVRGKEDGRQ